MRKYKDVSLSLVISVLKDKALAEDVLQDAFIKVFKSIDGFEFKSRFSTWLYRIVVNTSYNALKKEKPQVDIEDVEKDSLIEPFTGGEALTLTDQNKYIQQAFELLRPDEALVLRLFYLSELSMNEIEEVTGFSLSKIKVDLHRGRDNMYYYLKKILGEEVNHLL